MSNLLHRCGLSQIRTPQIKTHITVCMEVLQLSVATDHQAMLRAMIILLAGRLKTDLSLTRSDGRGKLKSRLAFPCEAFGEWFVSL